MTSFFRLLILIAAIAASLPSQAGFFSTSKKSLLKKLRQDIAEGSASIPEVIENVKKGTYTFSELPEEFINYRATVPTLVSRDYYYKPTGVTPLIYLAATAKDPLHFSLLVDLMQHPLFSSLDLADSRGSTALMNAVQFSATSSSIEAVKLLLNHHPNVNLQNTSGWTALMFAAANAASSSTIETVKLILEHDPEMDLQSKREGCTALMMTIALCKGTSDARIIPLLLAHNPDLSIINKSGENAFDLAKTSGVSKLLEEASKNQGEAMNNKGQPAS